MLLKSCQSPEPASHAPANSKHTPPDPALPGANAAAQQEQTVTSGTVPSIAQVFIKFREHNVNAATAQPQQNAPSGI